MNTYEKLSPLFGVPADGLAVLDRVMSERIGVSGTMDRLLEKNEAQVASMLAVLGVPPSVHADDVLSALRMQILRGGISLRAYMEKEPGANEFEKAASLARRIGNAPKGFFLKKEKGAQILSQHPPEALLQFLHVADIPELLAKHEITEIFSALRFIESETWMHETFRVAYASFTPDDFEERDIEIRVLGPEWMAVAEKFIAKKHHNVSHLKEFGVIFLNPVREDAPGKFVRDFALLFHYFHEISFYSKMFRGIAGKEDFATRFASLLRGDVPAARELAPGEWLIIQRYLWKDDPADPRLTMPHVNPESVHWFRAERDLAAFGAREDSIQLERWGDLDWVGSHFIDDGGNIVSFDLEDTAMTAVQHLEGKPGFLNYHQKEALWTKLFMAYAGGEEAMERLLIDNIARGSVTF